MYPTVSDVTALEDGGQAALDLAIAQVANYICPGVPDILEYKERSVTLRLEDRHRPPRVPFYGTRRLSAALLGYWPITGLTSVVIDDEDVTADCYFDRFMVGRHYDTGGFFPLQSIAVTFTTGYEELPSAIFEAIRQTAYLYDLNPGGMEMEKVGDVTLRYGKVTTTGNNSGVIPSALNSLPPGVTSLLDPYRLVEH